MSYMGISAHRHFREKTLCHTSRGMLAHPHFREQTMYYTSSVCQHIHASGGKKPHIHTSGKNLCIVRHGCVSTPTLQGKKSSTSTLQEKNLCIVRHGCVSTPTLQGRNFTCCMLWMWDQMNFVNRPHCFLYTALIFPTYEKSMGASMPVTYWQVLYWHLAYVKTLGEWTLVKYSVIFRATHGDG